MSPVAVAITIRRPCEMDEPVYLNDPPILKLPVQLGKNCPGTCNTLSIIDWADLGHYWPIINERPVPGYDVIGHPISPVG